MKFKSKMKWAALGGLVLSFTSLLVHLLLAKYSNANLVQYSVMTNFSEDLNLNIGGKQGSGSRKSWKNVKSLESLQPYANPRSTYPVPTEHSNGFIYAKKFGGFEKIRTSRSKKVFIRKASGFSCLFSKFKSFSYLYNEEQFIAALTNDIVIVKTLPPNLKEARKQKQYPTFKPRSSASPSFYINEVLPKLKKAKVIGLVLTDGGCLTSILPPSLAEYQKLRCWVAFHALPFRPEILALGHQMVERTFTLNSYNTGGHR